MTRFGTSVESVAAQLAGAPSGTTFNGYFAAVVSAAAFGFKLRRVQIGVRATGTPTSQQVTVGLYRQTVRASGTGLSNQAGVNLETGTTVTDPTSGVDFTTATTAGTTGPTIGANPIAKYTFNTQSFVDVPYELLELVEVSIGTANGLALVNIGATLPSTHLFVAGLEWEV